MDENEQKTLDAEYKRYLEIMRPYLGQLLDQDVIEICKAWIQRLSSCKENEKVLRNKYVFTLCHQLAKGFLEEPFLNNPTAEQLAPLPDDTNSDDSVNESTEVEYLVLDLDRADAKLLYNNENISGREDFSPNSELEADHTKSDLQDDSTKSNTPKKEHHNHKQVLLCYNCPITTRQNPANVFHENYEYRANNLVMKLREIKNQNFLLRNELAVLKGQSDIPNESKESENKFFRIDTSTSANIHLQGSNTTLNSLKCKLQEIQESRNILIETISKLQDRLDNFNDLKRHEIEEIHAQQKLEIIKVKNAFREELKTNYENELEKIKQTYESSLKDLNNAHSKELENKDSIISEKEKMIQSKEADIQQFKNKIEEMKSNHLSMFSKVLEHTKDDSTSNNMKEVAENFEKRLNKIEKAKLKSVRAYETKLANLQRDKHITECSLQLQLVKERAQIINETTDEYHMELATSLDKLESKYKDIVANVQATAVQRRIQDQMALESIIQAVCGIRNDAVHTNSTQATFPGHLPNKTMRNQTRDGIQNCDNDLSNMYCGKKIGNVIVGNKSYGDENIITGYCLEGEKLGEFFERVCIPQRDTGECSPKT